jgi:hypothetical protein
MEDRLKPSVARASTARSRGAAPARFPEALARASDAARHGTYFDCLGLATDATTTEVREAYLQRVRLLDEVRPALAGDAESIALLDETVRVTGDAFAVLSDPDLRLTYRRALLPAEGREPWRC